MKLSLLILLLIPSIYYSQDAEGNSESANSRGWQLGLNISPDASYRYLKIREESEFMSAFIESRNETEIPKFGYTGSISAAYNFNNKWGLEFGLGYSNKGFRTKKTVLTFADMDGDINPEYYGKIWYDYHYLDLPFKVNYTFGRQKIQFISSLGLSTNILLFQSNRSVFVLPGETLKGNSEGTSQYSKINLSPTASFGVQYGMNEKWNLRIEPTIRYGVLKIIDAPIIGYLFSGGINFGLYRTL